MTPSKAATREADKPKEDEPLAEEPSAAEEDSSNNNNSAMDEDELIIKDDIDQDCFEEVDRIGEIEKEVMFTAEIYVVPHIQVSFQFKDDHVEPKAKQVGQKDEIKADDNIETSNNDNEDSLNLTIGEEEEQLLRDEENDVKPKGELHKTLKSFLGGRKLTNCNFIHFKQKNYKELANNVKTTSIESDSKPDELEKPKEDIAAEKSKADL